MNKLVELAGGKPSDVVDVTIRGLEASVNWKDFKIDMTTFGHVSGDICVGCVATCAILELSGTHAELKGYQIREECVTVSKEDAREFEGVINRFRQGSFEYLFTLFPDCEPVKPISDLPWLYSDDWHRCLEPYRAYADQLRELGL